MRDNLPRFVLLFAFAATIFGAQTALALDCNERGSSIEATPTSNAVLRSGECLVSSDRKFVAVMQGDGNLVVYPYETYGVTGTSSWDTKTYGQAGAHLEAQQDGNVVVYTAGHAVAYAACSRGTPYSNYSLVLQSDANLVMYLRAAPVWAIWSSKTGCMLREAPKDGARCGLGRDSAGNEHWICG